MSKMKFTKKTPFEVLEKKKNQIFNFHNLYSVYLFHNNDLFRNSVTSKENITFPDGRVLSKLLGIPQNRGPTFTRKFLEGESSTKRHFFIGLNPEEEGKIKSLPALKKSKIKSYNPPYISEVQFPPKEVDKILTLMKSFKPDYVWVGIGNPKQEILSKQLFEKYSATYFNIGAALDFVLDKKKESPKIFRSLGLEWFYRLATDFKHTKKKAWQSFLGLKYLNKVSVE